MSISVKHGFPCYCDMLVPLNDYADDDEDVCACGKYPKCNVPLGCLHLVPE